VKGTSVTEGTIKKFLHADSRSFQRLFRSKLSELDSSGPNFLTVSSDFNNFSVEKMLNHRQDKSLQRAKLGNRKSESNQKQRYMNRIVWLLFLFEIVHTVKWLSMDSSSKRGDGKIFENRAILNFKTPLADQLGVARRETGRKRKQTPAMAEFINEQLTKKKRGRKSSKTVSSHFESDLTSTASATTTIRTEAELAEMAAALSHVPRDQWPDDVLTYQREQQRLKKRKDREMQIEDDRLRREVEQQRRQEQLAKIAADEPKEQRRNPRLRAATKAASGNVNRLPRLRRRAVVEDGIRNGAL
jgi:hypothetical protein